MIYYTSCDFNSRPRLQLQLWGNSRFSEFHMVGDPAGLSGVLRGLSPECFYFGTLKFVGGLFLASYVLATSCFTLFHEPLHSDRMHMRINVWSRFRILRNLLGSVRRFTNRLPVKLQRLRSHFPTAESRSNFCRDRKSPSDYDIYHGSPGTHIY